MWKYTNKIKIVYSVDSTVTYNDQKYPMAFVVTNDSQLKTATEWAKGYDENRNQIDGAVVETENKDFTLTIIKSADNSWSGGKRSFWTCLIEKDGIDTFGVGVNADFLMEYIKEATIIKGVGTEKVILAKDNGNLGAIVPGSSLYKELVEDENRRTLIATSKKTSKWRKGWSYCSLTQEDWMLGEFYDNLAYDQEYVSNRKYKYRFTNPGRKVVLWGNCAWNAKTSDKIFYILSNKYHRNEKIPARVENNKFIEFNSDAEYYDKLHELVLEHLEDGIKTTENWRKPSVAEVAVVAMTFYDIDESYTKDILEYLLKNYTDKDWATDSDDITLEWEGTNYTFDNWKDFIEQLMSFC